MRSAMPPAALASQVWPWPVTFPVLATPVVFGRRSSARERSTLRGKRSKLDGIGASDDDDDDNDDDDDDDDDDDYADDDDDDSHGGGDDDGDDDDGDNDDDDDADDGE